MATTPDSFSNLRVAALIFAFATAAYAAPQQNSADPLAPTNATVTISVGEAEPAASIQPLTSSTNAATIAWSDIKDYTSEKRGQFLAGLQRMEDKVNAQFNELTAKRSALKNTANAKELDQALNELNHAQFFLKAMRELISRTTPQSWEQMKAKVGLAWTKSQEAYAKVQGRTTS